MRAIPQSRQAILTALYRDNALYGDAALHGDIAFLGDPYSRSFSTKVAQEVVPCNEHLLLALVVGLCGSLCNPGCARSHFWSSAREGVFHTSGR